MPKISKKNSGRISKPETIMTLYEKVDLDLLERLLSAKGIDDNLRNQLKNVLQ